MDEEKRSRREESEEEAVPEKGIGAAFKRLRKPKGDSKKKPKKEKTKQKDDDDGESGKSEKPAKKQGFLQKLFKRSRKADGKADREDIEEFEGGRKSSRDEDEDEAPAAQKGKKAKKPKAPKAPKAPKVPKPPKPPKAPKAPKPPKPAKAPKAAKAPKGGAQKTERDEPARAGREEPRGNTNAKEKTVANDAPTTEQSAAGKGKKREKQKGGRLGAVLYTCLAFFMLLGMFTVCVVYDLFGLRGPILLFLNPEELSREEYYASEYATFYGWEDDIQQRELDLDARESELNEFEDTLYEREADLDARESDLDAKIDELGLNDPNASPETYDISNMVKTLESMTPAAAAARIEAMSDTEYVLRILRLMKPKSLAPIFEAMTIDNAASLMQSIGYTE